MNFSVLDEKRKKMLPFFKGNFSSFYLAGGTALALHFGHRNSIDFDFFTARDFDPENLFLEVKKIFEGKNVLQTQNEKNTLSVLVENEVKISFFTYPYPLLFSLHTTEYFCVASEQDIAAMKCVAIVQRATQKDYVDMFFLLQKYSLQEILDFAQQKFPEFSSEIILRSLVYFDDVEMEKIEFLESNIEWRDIQIFLETTVSAFIQKKQ